MTSAPEMRLRALIAAALEGGEALNGLARSTSEWGPVMDVGERVGVGGFLFHTLTEHGFSLPPPVERRERSRLFAQRGWSQHLVELLEKTLRVLEDEQIEAVSLKGPVFAERYYPAAHLRRSTDVDVLVAAEDVDRAAAALLAAGFQGEEPARARYRRRHHHHLTLFSKGTAVDLHFRALRAFGAELPSEPFMERATEHPTPWGFVTRVLSPEDELLYLSVHAAGHFVPRLSWLLDIALLVRAHPVLDGERVVDTARGLRLERALRASMDDVSLSLYQRPGLPLLPLEPWRYAALEKLRAISRRHDTQEGPLAQLLLLAGGALLCDRSSASVRFVGHHVAHIARRRAHRYLPQAVPPGWGG